MVQNESQRVVDENDPCIQNERLLEKYALMLGAANEEHEDVEEGGYEEQNS